MFHDILRGFQAIHAVALFFAALALFAFWFRTRLWLPRYVHALALLATLLGVVMAFMVADDAPINQQLGPLGRIVVVLISPALVYFFFIFYGGQRAAYENMMMDADSGVCFSFSTTDC